MAMQRGQLPAERRAGGPIERTQFEVFEFEEGLAVGVAMAADCGNADRAGLAQRREPGDLGLEPRQVRCVGGLDEGALEEGVQFEASRALAIDSRDAMTRRKDW